MAYRHFGCNKRKLEEKKKKKKNPGSLRLVKPTSEGFKTLIGVPIFN
jgi:hypothetical protein